MRLIRYACSHCGHQFEAEEKEGLECPLCFWSSSITPLGEGGKSQDSSGRAAEKKTKPASDSSKKPIIFVGIIFALITISLLVMIPLFASRIQKVMQKNEKPSLITEEKSSPALISDSAKPAATGTAPNLQPGNVPTLPQEGLSEEEKSILNRRLEILPDRPLNEEEKKILDHRASFSTGMNESVPSKTWTLEDFKNLIDQQQKLYQVPLARSYRSKLQKVFKQNYEQGTIAFENGELLKARDLWMSSLAFPVYANDIKKHRGVVLTMLRPFINDTLSKIGSINYSLVERGVRDRETQVTQIYSGLFDQIEKSDWQAVRASILSMDQLLDQLENPQLAAEQAPQYPFAIRQVDSDIQATLFEQLQVPPPPIAAMNALRADLQQKLKVAESFIPERLQDVKSKYESAMNALETQKWDEAEKLLREVLFPLALYQDAQEKIRILRKMKAPAIPASMGTTVPVLVKPLDQNSKKE